jgi:glycosyltransferase involved in cell wall biosynthesis
VTGRHVLFVAWWFPPQSGGGVHRPLQFVRHLARRGVRVTVLTGVARPGDRVDAALLEQVPAGVRIVRAPLKDPFRAWDAWKRLRGTNGSGGGSGSRNGGGAPAGGAPRWRDLVTEALALPDRHLPWIPAAVTKAALALKGDEPDLVFSTSPPASGHLAALVLRGLFSAPLVADFRDPWIDNPFRRYASPLFRRIDATLEARVVAEAAQVVLNTPALERAFRRRYPAATRVRTIPNGFDPDAFAGLPEPTGGGAPGFVEVAHFGQLYGLRSGRYLLQGLARLKERAPADFAHLRIVLHGSIDGEAGFREQAAALGVSSVLSIPGALTHRDSLARQRASDVLLLLGPEHREPEVQVPGKLYEYLAAQRPILTLSRAGGAIEEMLGLAGVPCERAEPDDPDAIAAALARCVRGAGRGAVAASLGTDAFRYDRLTDRLLECFEDAWAGRPAAAPRRARL